MPIYVPEDSGTTLQSIIDQVNRKLASYVGHHVQSETADGTQTSWKLTHENIIACTVTGGSTNTVDLDGGWVTYTVAPSADTALTFAYTYRHWSDEMVTEEVNSAVDELFGVFHVPGSSTLTTDGSQEYLLQNDALADLDPRCRITEVELWSDPNYKRLHNWRVRDEQDAKYLHFFTAPVEGYTVRFSWQGPPQNFVNLTDTLEGTVGLPTAAKNPIVLLAASELLLSRLAPRIRDDGAHNTQNENVVKSYEIGNAAAILRASAERKAGRVRMKPLRGRVVF
jgi:hypothetical protein